MSDGGNGRAAFLGVVLVVVCVVAVVVIRSTAPSGELLALSSPAPDGYAALAELLRDRGAEVDSTAFADAAAEPPGPGQVLYVPAPSLASRAERVVLTAAARRGAVVVWGEPLASDAAASQVGAEDTRDLAEVPAAPARPGACAVARVADLGPIDAAFAAPFGAGSGRRTCFGPRPGIGLVAERDVGTGRLVTLASPYLLVNARLWPAKEDGGRPLDNAALALRLFGPTPDGATRGTRVTFVEAEPSPQTDLGGQRTPLELLPTGVKLAVLQGFGAFVLYAWWRARRLGRPVKERMPVDVAGSELVVAVGDLLRRAGSPQLAAADLRASVRRTLAVRLGLPVGSPPDVLVPVVARRTGRHPDDVAALLRDGPVPDAARLVALARQLDQLRQEALDGQPVG